MRGRHTNFKNSQTCGVVNLVSDKHKPVRDARDPRGRSGPVGLLQPATAGRVEMGHEGKTVGYPLVSRGTTSG